MWMKIDIIIAGVNFLFVNYLQFHFVRFLYQKFLR